MSLAKILRFFGVMIVLLQVSVVQAESRKKKVEGPYVIDLGEEETQGTVRKPQLRVVEGQATVTALLPDAYRREFESAEAEFTRPKGVENGPSR